MIRSLISPFLCTLILILCDLVSKKWALHLAEPVDVFPGLTCVLVYNKGIAFGALSDFNAITQIVSILSFFGLAVYAYFKDLYRHYPVMLWILLFAGGIGNSLDRVIYGHVVDFIKLSYQNFHWFVFNFADIYLSMAVIYMLITEYSKKPIE